VVCNDTITLIFVIGWQKMPNLILYPNVKLSLQLMQNASLVYLDEWIRVEKCTSIPKKSM
jgi:hypothetical protein